MAVIVTRASKGTFLTFTEMDNNFINLNTDKVERDGSVPFNPGTVGTPTIRFSSSTSTGIFSSGANLIDVSISGVRVGGFTPAGYVGNLGTVTYSGPQDFSAGITVPTRVLGDNTTNAASTAFVTTAISVAGLGGLPDAQRAIRQARLNFNNL